MHCELCTLYYDWLWFCHVQYNVSFITIKEFTFLALGSIKLRRSKVFKEFSSPAAERFFIGNQTISAWSPTTDLIQAAGKHKWPDSSWKSVMVPGDFLICFEKSYCNWRIPRAIISTVYTVRARYRELWYPTRTSHVRVEVRLLLCRLPPKSYRGLLL